MPESSKPTVSIVLPTYNRATFLPKALAAIYSQQWSDWELIVVDDGSTDNTHALVTELTRDWQQRVQYVYQENQGAYGARNTGLDLASGNYIAFYDSDDLWLPHHLANCARAMDSHQDVDWVYGACRMVNMSSGAEICGNTFYSHGTPRPFLSLHTRKQDRLCIIDDPAASSCMIRHGIMSGLQNSLIRSQVFDTFRFESAARNEAEDQLIVVRALVDGRRFAYLDDVHVDYIVHDANSTSPAGSANSEKQRRLLEQLIEGYERLELGITLSPQELRALRQRLSYECFWNLGYATLWQNGHRREALALFQKGLRNWPWDWKLWKTYLLARLRYWAEGTHNASVPRN